MNSVIIHGIVKSTDELNEIKSRESSSNIEVDSRIHDVLETSSNDVAINVSTEPILGIKRSTLTALQRRKKKVKESGSLRLSHLEEDDDAEEC